MKRAERDKIIEAWNRLCLAKNEDFGGELFGLPVRGVKISEDDFKTLEPFLDCKTSTEVTFGGVTVTVNGFAYPGAFCFGNDLGEKWAIVRPLRDDAMQSIRIALEWLSMEYKHVKLSDIYTEAKQ